MAADASLLVELRAACTKFGKSEECEVALVNKAEDVLHRKDCTTGLRKMAAQWLHRNGRGKRDYLHLAVAIDSESTEFLLKVIRIWLKERMHNSIRFTDNEFLFYSSLLHRISKSKGELIKELSAEEFSELKRSLVVTVLMISEIRKENCTQLLKSVAKMFHSKEEIEKVIQFCFTELPLDMAGNILLITIFYSEYDISELHLRCWLSKINEWCAEQELASAASPLICHLISNKSRIPLVVRVLVNCLLSPISAVRVNVLRCWLGRITNVPEGIVVLEAVLVELVNRWTCMRGESQFWPILPLDTEDVSCVDPSWNWAESDGVTWIQDRILASYLKVWELLSNKTRTRKPEIDDQLVLNSLRWHDEEIRLDAFHLILTIENSITLQEDFLLANYNAVHEKLREMVHQHGSRFTFSKDSADAWKLLETNKFCDDKQDVNARIFLPDSEKIPAIPEEPHLDSFVNKLLIDGGSAVPYEVPTFPEIYAKLDKLGMNHRLYAKLLVEAMDKKVSYDSTDFETTSEFVWNIICRCRMKAVVDGGCTHLELLISEENKLAQMFFVKVLPLLFDPSCSVRTLVVSRILWSCCENDRSLFASLWVRIKEVLLPSAHPAVLTRVLKTLKLFLSKAACCFPPESVPVLFFFCLNAQEHPDFLTRSSAIIVFGFLLKSITDARQQFLFKFIAHYPHLWAQGLPHLCSLSSLPRQQRILLLTFLSRFEIGHPCFYAIYDIQALSEVFEQLEILRISSPDVRERRFCIDALLQFTPKYNHKLLSEKFLESVTNLNSEADDIYLQERIHCSSEVVFTIPKVVTLSEYYKRIDKISIGAHITEALDKLKNATDMDNEHSAQAFCSALTKLAQILMKNGSAAEIFSLCHEASLLVEHPFPRVRSLVSRIPVALGRTTLFVHGKYLSDYLSC